MEETVEVEVDSRGRISLGRAGGAAKRYRVTAFDSGELLLTPVVSISERELALLANPDVADRLRQAIKQAEAGEGKNYGAGYFARLAEELEADASV